VSDFPHTGHPHVVFRQEALLIKLSYILSAYIEKGLTFFRLHRDNSLMAALCDVMWERFSSCT